MIITVFYETCSLEVGIQEVGNLVILKILLQLKKSTIRGKTRTTKAAQGQRKLCTKLSKI